MPALSDNDNYGASVSVNNQGIVLVDRIFVGAPGDGTSMTGKVYMHIPTSYWPLALGTTSMFDGTTPNGATLSPGDRYGESVSYIADLAEAVSGAPSVPVLVVGAPGDDTGGTDEAHTMYIF